MIKPYRTDLLSGAAVDLSASSWESPIFYVGSATSFSIQNVFTGSPSGTFRLMSSNDLGVMSKTVRNTAASGVTSFTEVDDSFVTISASGDLMYRYNSPEFLWCKLVWDKLGGTGSLTVSNLAVKGY